MSERQSFGATMFFLGLIAGFTFGFTLGGILHVGEAEREVERRHTASLEAEAGAE